MGVAIVATRENVAVGIAIVKPKSTFNADPSVQVSEILNVKSYTKGAGTALYTASFKYVSGQAGMDGVYVGNASKNKAGNAVPMLRGAQANGFNKVVNAQNKYESCLKDGKIDADKFETYIFKK